MQNDTIKTIYQWVILVSMLALANYTMSIVTWSALNHTNYEYGFPLFSTIILIFVIMLNYFTEIVHLEYMFYFMCLISLIHLMLLGWIWLSFILFVELMWFVFIVP
jgi:hypothetical protein